ncbi:hypothetical protein KVR01_008598 [Diaporthe batatas]|uniref:uncharacterized protein n=1 Tax=Diaporthe batatas TaxID=748121 RepID=UPI001D054C46|nr:uncharacterized protein KVR01_008598 [Diaporthe batatas]KAG8161611.1 hypothetical protein KVR01_008598 [Diaporthe batatas]
MFVHPHLSTTQGALFHSSKRPRRHTTEQTSNSRNNTVRFPQNARLDQNQQQQQQQQHHHHHPTARATFPTPAASSLPRPAPRSGHYYDMPVDSNSISYISAVAAAARNLYRRAKISGPEFAEIATAVRPLHSVLKHLRAEAEDADSLLNSDGYESSVYARQLTPIVEDTDFTLKQLDTILEKYGSYPSDGESPEGTRRERANTSAKRMEDRERDMVALIRTKLANQKTNIDIFLDTVQLHNPTRQHKPVDLEHADGQQMDKIKDKVDVVAARLFQRRARALASGDAAQESEDQMWQQFWAELVKEGFSSDVLRKHKEVLRAYIRELDSNGYLDDKPPSMRGLLDQQLPQPYPEAPAFGARQPQQYGSSPLPPPVEITPASYPSNPHAETMSPKEMVSPTMDNEKFMPSVKLERRQPEQWPGPGDNPSPTRPSYNPYIPQTQGQQGQPGGPPPPPTSMPVQTSFERYSSDSCSDSGSTDSQQLALISTKDLMALDRNETDNLSARMGGLGLSPAMLPTTHGVSPGTSPNMRYLPPPVAALPSDHSLSSSPRYVPSLPGYPSPTSSTMTPPPPYASPNPHTAAPIPFPSSAPTSSAPGFPPPPTSSAPRQQRYSRLAPDSVGNEIPLEAKWTRIKRSLVSTEVLTKAGVRYEARPDFVAVLGVLTKEQIADYARKSAALRAGRGRGYSDPKYRPSAYYPEEKRNTNGRRHLQHSDSDSETDSDDVIWDESDTTDSESRDRSGAMTDKYIPREHRRRRNRRASTNSTIQEEPEPEDKGGDHKGHRVYPIIVEKTSPAAVTQPKPILKNRNENHVRFDEDGPREYSQEELEKERERKERRERRRAEREREGERRRRDRDRARERERERDRDRDRDREHRDRDSTTRERERDRQHRDRDHHDRERDRDHHPSSSSSHYRPRGGERERERDRTADRERDREREEARDKRRAKKRAWGETLGAVGIGGAAASLLGVLTEAASGL